MRKETIECDKCGAVKRETNHWYTVVYFDDFKAAMIIPANTWEEFKEVIDHRDCAFAYEWKDACGLECAGQLQSEALSERRAA